MAKVKTMTKKAVARRAGKIMAERKAFQKREETADVQAALVGKVEVFVELEGIIDIQQERSRLQKQKAETQKYIEAVEKKLHNPDFLANAPDRVVREQRKSLAVRGGKNSEIQPRATGTDTHLAW